MKKKFKRKIIKKQLRIIEKMVKVWQSQYDDAEDGSPYKPIEPLDPHRCERAVQPENLRFYQ